MPKTRPSLTLLLFIALLISGCGAHAPAPTATPAPTNTPTFTPSPTATFTPSPTLTPTPSPALTPTPVSPEAQNAALQTYKTMVLMQLAGQMLGQTAQRRANGEITPLEAGITLLVIATIVQGIEDAIPKIDPPFYLKPFWNQIQKPYQQTKDLIRSWFNDEITPKEVAQQTPAILAQYEHTLNAAEAILAVRYLIPKQKLTQKRQEIMQSVPEIFATATPTAKP